MRRKKKSEGLPCGKDNGRSRLQKEVCRDYTVLNPATLPEGMNRADYMRICFAMIDSADIVMFLPDYAESEGAYLEKAYCDYIEKDYYFFSKLDLSRKNAPK